MRDYHVIWEIDVTADSPREAAERARADQVAKGTWAVVFDVTDEQGVATRVDLLGDEPEDRTLYRRTGGGALRSDGEWAK